MTHLLILLVPGTRIELVQPLGPRDFKSLASTYSATQASYRSYGTYRKAAEAPDRQAADPHRNVAKAVFYRLKAEKSSSVIVGANYCP